MEVVPNAASPHASDPPPRKRRIEPEMLVGIGALLVSLCALGVGIYEAMLERHQVRAESWPHVELELSVSEQGFSIDVVNSGIGPAAINAFNVTLNGKPASGWPAILDWAFQTGPGYAISTVTDRVIRAGDRIRVLQMPQRLLTTNTMQRLPAIGISICYSSVFDEHWRADTPKLLGRTTWREVAECGGNGQDIGNVPSTAGAVSPF